MSKLHLTDFVDKLTGVQERYIVSLSLFVVLWEMIFVLYKFNYLPQTLSNVQLWSKAIQSDKEIKTQ